MALKQRSISQIYRIDHSFGPVSIKKALLVLTAILIAAAGAAQERFQLPPYTRLTLDNGLTIFLMEQHEVPLVQLTTVFPAGAVYDSKGKHGLADATASALQLGSNKYTKSQIEETVDYMGASLGTVANKETGMLYASFLKKDQKAMLDIIQDILLYPVFPEGEWKKLQDLKLAKLDQMKESPRSSIQNYYDGFVFGGHPYGNAEEGNKEDVRSLTISDLKDFYGSHYVPNGAVMAVVGDFEAKEMGSQLKTLFNGWKKGSPKLPEMPTLNYPDSSRVLLVDKKDARETTFLIGGKGIPRNNPDYVGVQVVNTILGGRFTSWLNDELRVNSGLTYGAGSRFNTYKLGGTFTISTFTANETTEQAIDLALKTYDRLHTQGVDAATLESAKNYLKGQFPPEYETNASLAGLLTDMHLYGFDESYIDTFTQKVDDLDRDQLDILIKKYFPKEHLQFVLIGKADGIGEMAKKYGKLETRNLLDDGF
tara:strand:+ start:29863 stop:31308 length:1446 start_codon:yes stop_codon:yes gene_type:complete